MVVGTSDARQTLQAFDFARLFIEELGWNRLPGAPLPILVEETVYRLQPVAQKAGMAVYHCLPGAKGIPDSTVRARIEKALTRQVREHILIFTDRGQQTQLWQWVRREPGKPDAVRTQRYERGQSGERLLQRLEALKVSLAEEERGIGIVVVGGKAAQAFDVDRVTKRFYEKFDGERKAFVGFITGLEGAARDWYAALMLNRLMFIYFIQKKGFLDGNPDYLRVKLQQMQAESGTDQFLTFYRRFLLRLFHEGLGQAERSPELDGLLGKVPYLNGGLFDVHQLEREHADIAIPDSAFARVFAFFDAYEWHLDDRPLHADNEINPDVLGYIFEKYINQKQMGAYYTKEDITEYISKNTIIPHLCTTTEEHCEIAFRSEGALWGLLREQPDRYIYDAVKRGVDFPLPADIAAGVADVAQRSGWNRQAAEGYALPTETWREHVARRTRCLDVRARLAAGEVHQIDDLITLNLNMRQFAQDAITFCEGSDLLRAFFEAIRTVTVLDPTCGSGAFLFAALNILEPLYEACLERMRGFVGDADRTKATMGRYADFRLVLKGVAEHPSARYYILKSIILNNLFGVDIMDEAVEICKLRLFLKLVAQVERYNDIEPLPDIDFNIRAGNTLVGYATAEEVRQAIGGGQQLRMDFDDTMPRLNARLAETQHQFAAFRTLQTDLGEPGLLSGAKAALRDKLNALSAELDGYLAAEYGITADQKDFAPRFANWSASHQPFHWLVEFYGVMDKGGFDVVIGNPPYVEYAKVRSAYAARGYSTEKCGNLYAFVVERSLALQHARSLSGLIVPLSLVCTARMQPLREVVVTSAATWTPSFDMRPSSLFDSVAQRLTILLRLGRPMPQVFAGGYRRWTPDERPTLLAATVFGSPRQRDDTGRRDVIPKISNEMEASILAKLIGPLVATSVDESAQPIFVHRIVRYFVKALDAAPLFVDPSGRPGKSEDYKEFRLRARSRAAICALLNSSLFYWFWRCHSDGFHCGYADVYRMPLGPEFSTGALEALTQLQSRLNSDLQTRALTKQISTVKGRITYEEFYPKYSKPLIDEIDRVLARHYGFSEEELDFIINYDIKYRMGRDDAKGDDT